MASQKRLVRADHRSDLRDVANRIIDRDKGNFGDNVVWRYDGANYTLDILNATGNHAIFGNGIVAITDGFVQSNATTKVLGAHTLEFWNAGNTNLANLYHAGTDDNLKTDDSFQTAVSLNVGPTIAATDAGDGYFSGGVSLGTFTNPGVGELLASGKVQGLSLVSTTTAGAPIAVSSTTRVTSLNVDLLDDKDGTYYAAAPLTAACTTALTLSTTATDVGGCSISLVPATYLVIGVFQFIQSGAAPNEMLGTLVTSGGSATITDSTSNADFVATASNAQQNVMQSWIVAVTATTTAKLQARRTVATGTSTAGAVNTKILAIQGIGA